jgi:hypothetical protein
LAKYEEKGVTQKQKKRPYQAKDTNRPSEHREQSASHLLQGNNAFAPYSFGGPVAPWFWSYPYYYTPLDYSRMSVRPYFIQYSSTYSSYGAFQRPIVASDNPFKSKIDCSMEGEKDVKLDNQYLQPRWCPSGLPHTQKRRLQWMRKKESMEQQEEDVPARSATMKQVWRPKQVVLSSA